MNAAQLRLALPRTWDALLARHRAPNEIQLAAASPLLAGRDVLLCAPTASGKTEAYLAPLVERCTDPPGAVDPGPEPAIAEDAPPRILLVSPTRALANDLHRRVSGALARCGVAVGRWTGDSHDGGTLQVVTVLTPEALDARLSRTRGLLRSVRALVLDELHELDGTPRGDQLRVLVQRLRHGQEVQVVAASATVPDVDALARRYLRDPEVVRVGDRRRLLARLVQADGPIPVAEVLEEEVQRGFRKILAFASSREAVETYASALRGHPPFGDAVFAHHGSLARLHRLKVEEQFLRRPVALCVATSTLELGIDIGDIDLVALLGVPPDIPALVQRAGRGGRRQRTNPVLCLARSDLEERIFRVMLEAQARGALLADPYHFRPGVLFQQAISLLFENPGRWVSARGLHARLPADLAAAWMPARLDDLLCHMARLAFLERGPEGRFTLGERGERNWSRSRLHANLDARDEQEVRDFLTGDPVASVAHLEGDQIQVGGRGRRVLREDGPILVTRSDDTAALASFGGGPRPPVSRALSEEILRALAIPIPCLAWARGHALFHGLGSAGGALLAATFRCAGAPPVHAGPLALRLFELPEVWPGPDLVDRALGEHHRGMARALGMGAWHPHLPELEQARAVGEVVDLDAVRAFVAAGPPPSFQGDHVDEAAHW